LSYQELYRRVATTPVLNANSSFAGNTTGYAIGGSGGGTLSYSTAQFISSPGAGRYVPSGSSASPTVESTPVTIDPTQVYLASGWIRPDTTTKPVQIAVNWYTSGGTYISTSAATITATPVANAWQFLYVVADPTGVATAAKASLFLSRGSGTPAAGDAWYVDDMELEVYNTDVGVRIASGLNSGATFNDWGAAASVDYEYQLVVYSSNQTHIAGPWTE
jgi:hypothetical protein